MTRSRIVTEFTVDPPRLEADTVFPVDAEFQGVLDGNNAVVGWEQLDQGIEQRRLTRAGPARHEDIPPPEQRGARLVQHFLGQRAEAHKIFGRIAPLAESPDRDGNMMRGRRHTDRHAGAVVQARIEDRRGGRIEAQGPRDLNGRPFQRSLIEARRGMGPDFALAFNPDVTRSVDHDLADFLIFEDRFQPRQERAQIVHAAFVVHIFPASMARQ